MSENRADCCSHRPGGVFVRDELEPEQLTNLHPLRYQIRIQSNRGGIRLTVFADVDAAGAAGEDAPAVGDDFQAVEVEGARRMGLSGGRLRFRQPAFDRQVIAHAQIGVDVDMAAFMVTRDLGNAIGDHHSFLQHIAGERRVFGVHERVGEALVEHKRIGHACGDVPGQLEVEPGVEFKVTAIGTTDVGAIVADGTVPEHHGVPAFAGQSVGDSALRR